MLNFKSFISNNKLLFSNVHSCQILASVLVLCWGVINLDGYALNSMLFVTLANIGLNVYVLKWCFKNKIYDAELFLQAKFKHTVVAYSVFTFLFALKTIFYYFVVSSVFGLFFYLTGLSSAEYQEHFWVFSFLWFIVVVAFIMLIVGGSLLHMTRVISTMDKLYPTEITNLVKQFKLNINETNFCTSGHDITGFVSSGFTFTDNGIVYNGSIFSKESVTHYLNAAGIKLSELDEGHIKVMTMYNYA